MNIEGIESLECLERVEEVFGPKVARKTKPEVNIFGALWNSMAGSRDTYPVYGPEIWDYAEIPPNKVVRGDFENGLYLMLCIKESERDKTTHWVVGIEYTYGDGLQIWRTSDGETVTGSSDLKHIFVDEIDMLFVEQLLREGSLENRDWSMSLCDPAEVRAAREVL